MRDQGKLGESEALYRKALESYREGMGARHPETLEAMDNLASVLRDQNKMSEVEALLRER
jgi:hypothetical protein